ncbi:MAG: sulfatase [Candidatus Promineifilaceae bacterium]
MKQADIVFIVLDTQRVDRLGCYGYQSGEQKDTITPNLDAFANDGALFESAISPAQWTIPSHASMFTGLYPTAHQVTQSNHTIGPGRPHIAELLRSSGYQTIGFCNNPLVGVLDNGFKRGFDCFYNYGGAIPSMPKHSTRLPWPVNWLLEGYTQFLRRISYPIQNFFGRSDLAFRISLNAFLTPLWSKMANFKGQNARSVRDIVRLLRERENLVDTKPLFMFVNLMETHLPFLPPGEYVDRVAPYMRSNKEARDIMRRWNREAYRWAAPLGEPLQDLEGQVLSDMYDAEVAYQDDYLGPLFELLSQRENADNTLTVIVSDHGDGLGEHDYFGHAFVAYQELIHVPLILHWPERISDSTRVDSPVSTRRIYHTILDAAGLEGDAHVAAGNEETSSLTLLNSINGPDPESNTAFAEVYPPLNFAKAVQHRQPELLERFRCLATRRAVVKDNLKLIQVAGSSDELFDVGSDPLEMENLIQERPDETADLANELEKLENMVTTQSDMLEAGATLDVESDEQLVQRLRGLGYIE